MFFVGLVLKTYKLNIRPYILKSTQKMILLSDLTKSGTQVAGSGVVVYPVGDVTPPCPAK
jgi:hypothetical protein